MIDKFVVEVVEDCKAFSSSIDLIGCDVKPQEDSQEDVVEEVEGTVKEVGVFVPNGITFRKEVKNDFVKEEF